MLDGIVPVTEDKLNNLNDEVIRFGKLLNNLNDLKELEEEEIELHMERLSINKLISSVCNDFSVAAAEKNINLMFNKQDEKSYFILGDIDKLKQVFINLISNSIKFTKENGSVWVDISSDKDHIIIQVKDNGIGIFPSLG